MFIRRLLTSYTITVSSSD